MDLYVGFLTALTTSLSEITFGNSRLERTFLGKGIARQRRALRTFRHLDADGWSVRSGDPRRTQHGILREHFAVHLGDQIIQAIGVVAPDLPKLDGTYGHKNFFEENGSTPDYRGKSGESIIPVVTVVTEVSAKMLPLCPAAEHPVSPPATAARTVWRGRPFGKRTASSRRRR